jgi:uncharacterized integral membrane protein (TIGR00698 family)
VSIGLPRGLVHGLAWTSSVALVAWLLSHVIPLFGAPVLAILIGLAVSLVRRPSPGAAPGIAFSSTVLLQIAIVLLGTGLALGQVVRIGAKSLPVMLGTLAVALIGAVVLGKLLAVSERLRTLIGVGTGICGASAIAAVSGVVNAKRSEVAYAVATIFAMNVVGVLSFPLLAHLLGLSQEAFGLWAGTAVNDTSSVVAAAAAYGDAARDEAVIVKLTRATLIVPVVLAIAATRIRRSRRGGDDVRVRRLVPWFVLHVLALAAANTAGLVPARAASALVEAAVVLVTAALAAVGLSADGRALRSTGLRPLVLGALVWLLVVTTTLALMAGSGQM